MHPIPPYIYDLYVLAKASFTLYEQEEKIQSTETAFELRDLADHIIYASQESDPDKAESEYQRAAEHILNIVIDPLQRRVHRKVIRIQRILRWYWWYRLLFDMPNRVLVKRALLRVAKSSRLIDAKVSTMRTLKGRTDVSLATECFNGLASAYKTASDIQVLLQASLQNLSVRAQSLLFLMAVIALVLTAASLWFTVIPYFQAQTIPTPAP